MTSRATEDWQLLQDYAKDRSEAAFAGLVTRHLDWVYSVAFRNVDDPHLAQDVVQSVFVLLAHKARTLRSGTLLTGWLFRTTLHVAAHARRAELRRKIREATACTMNSDTTAPDPDGILWQQLAPHLDLAVAALSESDRAAILLRFYEKAPLGAVGERLGISEDAAKKRVSRALEKMRTFLVRRGVKPGAAALVILLAAKTVEAAPAALAASVVKLSVGAVSASTATGLPKLAHETLRAWRWAKVKLVAAIAAPSLALLLIVGGADGWLTKNFGPPPATANVPGGADIAAVAQSQTVAAFSVPAAQGQSTMSAKTGAITGLVVDETEHPIAGAKVWGGFDFQPFAQDTTDKSGHFALDTLAAPELVTVTADGFAADQQGFAITNGAVQLVFHLRPVPPLRIRLVDESGRGVAGVSLFLYQWWGKSGTLASHLEPRTDSEGRLRWLSPPKGELELQFGSAGYRASRTNKFAADGEEHIIVMHPAVTLRGSVVDAETGAPVTSFNLTLGQTQQWNPQDPLPLWDRRSRPASNGSYQILIDEEPVPYLRIEAEGYETVESRIQLTNEIEAVWDFQLKRRNETNSIRGTVLLPDGAPAVGVEVALCTAQVGVMLRGTAFEPHAFGSSRIDQESAYRTRTDQHGLFSFAPQPGAHTVVAVGLAGLGQTRCFDFSKPLEVRLQAWGRIEGNIRTRNGQWGDRLVKWRRTGPLTSWMTLFYSSDGFSTWSDATGKFTLEHVPPGDGRVGIDDGDGMAPIWTPSIQVDAGGTAQVQIGGVGRPVIGRLVVPAGFEIRSWSNQVTLAQLHVEWDAYALPKDLTGNAAERWKLEFEDTAAGRTWFRDQYSYEFRVRADGSFTIPEVLPGKYSWFVNVAQGSLGSGTDLKKSFLGEPQIAWAGGKIQVPQESGDDGSTINLGEVTVVPTR